MADHASSAGPATYAMGDLHSGVTLLRQWLATLPLRDHDIDLLLGLLVLSALMGACLGLFMGTVVPPAKVALLFTLIVTPLLFTGCGFYPWATLGALRWFQIVTLFNPLTYADEGIRYAMVPPLHGHTLATLDLHGVLVGLGVTVVPFGSLDTRTFLRRVVS